MTNIQQETEIEYKSLLTKEEYDSLHETFEEHDLPSKSYVQTNYYFDTPSMDLSHQKITLRLRQKGGTWELTIKAPTSKEKEKGTLYQKKQEYNMKLSDKKALSILNEKELLFSDYPMLDVLSAFIKTKKKTVFELLGSLTTERTDYQYGEDLISLDKSTYNGQVDYELEWETAQETVPKALADLELNLGNGSGKKKRFLNSLPKKNG